MVKKFNSKLLYHINLFNDHAKIQLKFKDKILLEFEDTILEKGNLNSFSRKTKNHEYIFIDSKLIVKKTIKQTKFLTKIIPYVSIKNNFIIMDLETRTIDGIMEPYAISRYDGNNLSSLYLLDYNNSD